MNNNEKKTSQPPMEESLTPEQRRQFEQLLKESQSRARSVSVGTCFGGTVEISMRRPDASITFALLQPVEVIELINQLSASVGCHIHIYPRKDFASWREWKDVPEELTYNRGFQNFIGSGQAPHPNDMAPHNQVGANLPPPEKQPGTPSFFSNLNSNEKRKVVSNEKKKQIKRVAKKTPVNINKENKEG